MNTTQNPAGGFRQTNVGNSEFETGASGVKEHTYPPNRRDFPQRSSSTGTAERWASAAAGGIMLLFGLKTHSAARWPFTLAGAGLLFKGLASKPLLEPVLERVPILENVMPSVPKQTDLHIKKSVTINRPVEEVYAYWRNLENLPRFMKHIKSVQPLEDNRSHWVATVLRDMEVEWDAQILVDRPNEMIAWESLPGARIENRGNVKFVSAPGGRGTEVHVSLEYLPPGAAVGRMAAGALNFVAEHQIKEDIRNFKNIMEAGELPTTDGQPAARGDAWHEFTQQEAAQQDISQIEIAQSELAKTESAKTKEHPL